jgi:nitric oxide reductase large subunit
MSVATGAKRMKIAGRWMVIVAVCAFVLFTGLGVVRAFLPFSEHFYGFGLLQFVPLLVLFYIGVPGAILWLAGWIVEGFANEDSKTAP